jgi:hypothetical protein
VNERAVVVEVADIPAFEDDEQLFFISPKGARTMIPNGKEALGHGLRPSAFGFLIYSRPLLSALLLGIIYLERTVFAPHLLFLLAAITFLVAFSDKCD